MGEKSLKIAENTNGIILQKEKSWNILDILKGKFRIFVWEIDIWILYGMIAVKLDISMIYQ